LFLILISILVRSELLLRGIYEFVICVVRHGPVSVKHFTVRNLLHVGGFHSSLSLCGIMWLCYAIYRSWALSPELIRDLGITCTVFLLIVACAAFPPVRFYFHNFFENTHRIFGWSSLGLIWVYVILAGTYNPSTVITQTRSIFSTVKIFI
jgi:hypothetical protein